MKDFIVDDESWQVRYLVIHTGVWFLGKDALLSPSWIEKLSCDGAEAFVNLPRSIIKDAPAYDDAAPLSRAFEQRLHDITMGANAFGMQWKARARRRDALSPPMVSLDI